MASRKDTKTAQNILASVINELELQVDDPYIKMKAQYHRAEMAMRSAYFELDILNDMIDEYQNH